jgi:hypothetical protein
LRQQIDEDEHFLKVGMEGLTEKTGGMILTWSKDILICSRRCWGEKGFSELSFVHVRSILVCVLRLGGSELAIVELGFSSFLNHPRSQTGSQRWSSTVESILRMCGRMNGYVWQSPFSKLKGRDNRSFSLQFPTLAMANDVRLMALSVLF